MCTSMVADASKVEAFGQTLVGILNHAGLSLMISIGHRTGLFDAMATMGPASSEQIAERGGWSERYVREWLGAMVTGSIVEYDAASKAYHLPAEAAAWLTRAAAPNNFAVAAQWTAVLGNVEDEVVAAFKHSKGVPYSAYKRFHIVMAEESAQSVVAGLEASILPLVPGLTQKLAGGINVLDVGCGSGQAMAHLAQLYPNSRFLGIDASEEGIAAAKVNARANLRFEVRDAAEIIASREFDLIFAFDAIHDQAKPDRVLSNIAEALKPDGLFFMQDISGTGDLHADCKHPVGPFLYTISCMHCMSVSLANGGPGLGAMWGKEKALTMLKAAGFNHVDVKTVPHDPMNFWYAATL